MTIGIIGALEAEIKVILGNMDHTGINEHFSTKYYIGTYENHTIVLVCSSIGTVNAAISAATLINTYHVDIMINTGIAGALDDRLSELDIIVSESVQFHDADLNLLKEYHPFQLEFAADADLAKLCKTVADKKGHRIWIGKIATGNIFVKSSEDRERIKSVCQALCVEMEGAAIGQACYEQSIPFLVLRTISDRADEDAPNMYDSFLKKAADQSAETVLGLIQSLPKVPQPTRTIDSFSVDHTKLKCGLYLSKKVPDCETYDLRAILPNSGKYLQYNEIHTFEHLFATYIRNSFASQQIIYFGPMGCQTGFYLIVRDSLSHDDVILLVRKVLLSIIGHKGVVPGSTIRECGNAQNHNISRAKQLAKRLYSILSEWTVEQLSYPV